ncbi:MAG: DUF3450 family protein [Acidobacteriota bacterium]|jgi:hypothetical protein
MTRTQKCISLLTGVLLVSGLAPAALGAESDAVRSARESLDKWVETRQVISKEREDWAIGKEVLEQRTALIEGEIATIEGKIAEMDRQIDEADERRAELVAEKKDLRDASAALADAIGTLEEKTLRLTSSLPEPIRRRVAPLSGRIPAEPGKTGLSLSERFQNVVGVLNEVNKFNQEITLASEIRSLPDGSSTEVQTLYVGLGQAYYVNTAGTAAGVGRPGPEGWVWTPANEMAPEIAQAIAVQQGEEVPTYVPLPVEIR